MAVETDPRVGTKIAGYRIERLLGRGERSVVYRATSERTRGPLVLKLIQPSSHHDPDFGARLINESKLVSSFDHPNLVRTIDAGEANGLLYVAMAYIDGFDLRRALSLEGGLEPRQAVAIIGAVADALDTARWARGLVHGNVKPSNILIPSGSDPLDGRRAVLTDFGSRPGISNNEQMAAQLSSGLAYVAPEQSDGRPANARTDVYALGCVLYECLTGEPPYQGTSASEILKAHLRAEPPVTGVNTEIDRVLAGALAKWPEERNSTCTELALAAQRALSPGSARPAAGVPEQQLRPRAVAIPPVRPPPTCSATEDSTEDESPAHAKAHGRLTRKSLLIALLLCIVLAALVSVAIINTGDSEQGWAEVPIATTNAPGEPNAAVTPTATEGDDAGAALQVLLPVEENTLVRIDSTGEITDFFQPAELRYDSPVAFGRSAVWLATPDEGTLSRVELDSRTVTNTVGVPGNPKAVGLGHRSAWVLSTQRRADTDLLPVDAVGTVSRIDPRTGETLATIEIDHSHPVAMTVHPTGVWIAAESSNGHAVLRIDPEKQAVAARILLPGRPVALAANYDAVWVAGRGPWLSPWDPAGHVLTRIDPVSNTIVETIELDHPPGESQAVLAVQDETSLAVRDGAVWVASEEGTLTRVRPATNRIAGTIRVEDPTLRHGIAGIGVALADGWVWIASSYHRHVLRIDPDEGEITKTILLPGRPNSIDSVGDDIWVTVTPPERVG